jgi:PAS domain S-box-containing protein
MTPTLQASLMWGIQGEDQEKVAPSLPYADAAGAENRREQRLTVDQAVEVFGPATAKGKTWKALIRDISTRGMQLLVEETLPFGPEIRIRWNGREVKGTIRHTHKFDTTSFRVGVELAASCETLIIEMLASQAEELQRTKRLLERMQASMSRAIGLLDLIAEAVIMTSPGGIILFWNRGAERLYGWTREEALGRQLNQMLESTNIPELPEEGVFTHRRKDGSRVTVMNRSSVQPETQGLPAIVIWVQQEAPAGRPFLPLTSRSSSI